MPFTSGPPTQWSRAMLDKRLEFVKLAEGLLSEIMAIEQASFSDPWSENMFRQELGEDPGKYSVVLILDGSVAGYGIGWIVLDEFHLGNLAVRPDLKGQGFGSLILNRMLATAAGKECRTASLEVRISNHAAIKLYQKYNFIETAIRRRYYRDEDALVMMARLDGTQTC